MCMCEGQVLLGMSCQYNFGALPSWSHLLLFFGLLHIYTFLSVIPHYRVPSTIKYESKLFLMLYCMRTIDTARLELM